LPRPRAFANPAATTEGGEARRKVAALGEFSLSGYGRASSGPDGKTMRRFWIASLASVFVAGAAVAAQTPRLVGDYASEMNDIAHRLDLQLADRQKAGEAAAAQRLALAAAMIRRASAEFRGAEQGSLTDDVNTLPAPIKARLDAAFSRAGEAERRAAAEPRFVDEAHAAFNALIDVLPIKTPHPTLYGLMSNDLTDPSGRLSADVVIYGDRLIDPVYGVAPGVAYGGADLPAAALHASDDRIEITLPPATKAAMHYAPPPCEQRASFGLRVHSVYALAHGFWPIVWHTQVDSSGDLFALASPVLYEAQISAEAEAVATTASTVAFRRRSDFVVADCEQTRAVEVAVVTPEGASDVVCQAAWVNATGRTATSGRCEQREGALSASGALTGPPKVCSPDKLCACSTNGQGFLEISGTYRISRSANGRKLVADLAPLAFPLGGLAHQAFGSEQLRLLKIDVARRDCPVVADTMTIALGEDAGASGAAVSKSGAFRALFEDGRLSVGSAQAFAP
jgi:hypothetical protein